MESSQYQSYPKTRQEHRQVRYLNVDFGFVLALFNLTRFCQEV